MQLVDYEYQSVLGGKALVLKRLRQRFFSEGATRLPTTSGWRQEMVREVIGEVEVNEAIQESHFAVELPPGTRINDSTHQITLGQIEPSEPMWPRIGLIGINAGAVVVLLPLVVAKSLRRSQKRASRS